MAWENGQLRLLLAHRGLTAGDVDGFLNSQRVYAAPLAGAEEEVGINVLASLASTPRIDDTQDARDASYLDQPPPFHYHYHDPRSRSDSVTVKNEVFSPPSMYSRPPEAAPNEMSCEAAASIISSMRGGTDQLQARMQLGCGDREYCTVKNVKVFQVMDLA